MSFLKKIIKKISPFMRDLGFSRSGNHFYIVINELAFCISLEMPTGVVYATTYVMPLYIPCENRYYTYGNRMNYIEGMDVPLLLKSDDETAVNDWCDCFCTYIEQKLIPFYKRVNTPQKLIDYMDNTPLQNTSYIFCSRADVWQLKMFTHFYYGEHEKVRNAAKQYCEEIKKMPFTESVIQDRITDVDKILHMLNCEVIATDFCHSTVHHTQSVLGQPKIM